MSSHDRFPCIDGLRAIAALGVLVLHVGAVTGENVREPWGNILSRFDVAVPVFFAISAFLLYRPFALAHFEGESQPSARHFWWKRLLRIYPAYWVAVIVIGGVLHNFSFREATTSHTVKVALEHLTLTQIYTDYPWQFFGWIDQTWSLAIEVSFYLVLPVYAGLMGRVTRGARASGASVKHVELVGAGLVYFGAHLTRAVLLLTHDAPTPSTSWLPAQFDLFAIGIGLAVLSCAPVPENDEVSLLSRVAQYPGLCWGAAAVVFIVISTQIGLPLGLEQASDQQVVTQQFLYGVIALFMLIPLIFGSQDAGFVRRLLQHRLMAGLGVISYGIFLWHFDLAVQFADFGLIEASNGAPGFFSALLIVMLASVAVATLTYYLIERPMGRYRGLRRA